MGCLAGGLRVASLRVCSDLVFHFPVRALVAPDLHGVYLLNQHFVEHERHLAQSYPQPILYLPDLEPVIQHPVVGDVGNLPNVLQICASSASHGE